MSEKAGIGWTTSSHTGVNVPVYAIGSGSEKFSGYIDNTDIPKIMEQLIGKKEVASTLK
jgi:alkaline phosphatase